MTALHIAIQAGVTDVVDVLLANGASTSIKTASGETATHLAVRDKRWQVLRKLQDYGAVLDAEGLDKLEFEEYELEGLELEELDTLIHIYLHTLHKSGINVSDGGRLSMEKNIKPNTERTLRQLRQRLTYHLSHRRRPLGSERPKDPLKKSTQL